MLHRKKGKAFCFIIVTAKLRAFMLTVDLLVFLSKLVFHGCVNQNIINFKENLIKALTPFTNGLEFHSHT